MKLTIPGKMVLLLVPLVVCLEAGIGFYFVNREKDMLLREFDESAMSLTQSLVVSCEQPLRSCDQIRLATIADTLLEQPHVAFCQITDKNKNILLEKGTRTGLPLKEYALPVLAAKTSPPQADNLPPEPETEQIERIGDVCLLFSLAELYTRINEARGTAIVAIIAGASFTLMFLTLLVRFLVSQPVGELIQAVRRVSNGDLDHKVPVRDHDEIGQLADAFNSMTQDLQQLFQKEIEPAAKAAAALIEDRSPTGLEEAYHKLEKVNGELNDFAHVVSHDLKAPLRGIKTLADWISADCADKLDDDAREQINLLLNRVDRMQNLIDGILQYSRLGHTKEDKVRVDLSRLVPEVIDMVAPPHDIEITISNELPTIEFDKTRMIQIFQNLLSNAVKYMDKAQGQISIGCVDNNGYWQFSVADNGPGIEEKHFENIFRIFRTLQPRDEFESTGIGLTLVKRIVESHGGKIWVESKMGHGSTFLFQIPKEQARIKDERLQASPVG